ncbi:MAG: hypothetical protein D0433_10610 [Candidatus Thermochlorobacter aerophilum]|jgi:hypothetical protein|uniref:Uncharacterized protein n=1 Tax=Candidatus Thermochlorobacter aerophilus TaxID=1868324 RepID=A0A395LYJ2_9BACT|nr:MAG: hypothetical protein D0433_10610 [Candidatus Thermochlorobacter aerophilum]
MKCQSPVRRKELRFFSYLLSGSALFNFVSALALLYSATDGFSTSLPHTREGSSVIAATFASALLVAANFVYQLVLRMNITFSSVMLIAFVISEVFFSLFLWSLH